MKHVLLGLLLFFSVATFAQVGIGTTTPLASAILDVRSTNKGFLPPRVTLTSATDATTIASPAEGLLVYNLGSTGLLAGYYYWNGAKWSTIATATSADNVAQKVSALVNAGTYVQLDNIKATVTTSGNRGLSVAAVGTSFYCNIGATFGGISAGGGGGSGSNVIVTTTPSTSLFNWSFASTGEISVYNVTDVTSNRVYRITLQIGASYLSNFICIERLL